MKQKLFSIGCMLGLFAAMTLMTGCAKEFDNSSAAGEKPAAVAEAEHLASYGTLTTYIDAANFRLGNTLASSEFDEGTAAASLTLSNFNDVTIPDLFVHSQQVDNEGNINMLLAASMAKDVCEKGINVFAPALCASTNINTTYLSQLIEPETVEEDEVTGYDVIDFEADAPGTAYPLQKATGDEGKGSAAVEDDPDGQTGHVIHVTKTNNSYVAITYKFPEGRKLGDYSELTFDYRAVNATALNQKVFFAMGGKNAEELFWQSFYAPYVQKTFLTTDDGSLGSRGFTTTIFPQVLKQDTYDGVLVCGPEIMMRSIAKMAAQAGIPCQVSLEKRMACGLGACLSCSIDTTDGKRKKVCKDGPVFWAEEVFA